MKTRLARTQAVARGGYDVEEAMPGDCLYTRAAMTTTTIHLRKENAPGRGEKWTLELTSDLATLRDSLGETRYTCLPEDAALAWIAPSFSGSRSLKIPFGDRPASFACRWAARPHIQAYLRLGISDTSEEVIRATRHYAYREMGIGVVLIAGGAIGSVALLMNSSKPGQGFFFVPVFLGAVAFGRGIVRWRLLKTVEREQIQRASVGATALRVSTEAIVIKPPRPVGRWFLIAFLCVMALISAAIALLIYVPFGSASPSRPSTVYETGVATAPDPSIPPPPELANLTVSDGVQRIAPPTTVEGNELTSDDRVLIFLERENHALGEALRCDAAAPTKLLFADWSAAGSIPAGSRINSYFVHAEVTYIHSASFSGRITFPTEVLGVIATRELLDASDTALGHAGVAYPRDDRSARGWFDGGRDDFITISADRRTVTYQSRTGEWSDQFRVITRTAKP